MSLGRKISQISKLSELKPDERWETTTKYDLMAEISSQNRMMQAQKLSNTEKTDLAFMNLMNKMAPSFTKMVAGFLIVMMSSGVGFAAQASVPGEILWPIKRSIEKVELSLTISPVGEAKKHMKHVDERLKEIKEILEEENGTVEKQEKKEKAIKTAVRHLEKDVTAVDTSLKIVKEEKKPIEVVELAKKVTETTKKVTVALEEKAAESGDKEIEEALDSVKEVNEEVQKSAVSVAIEVHEEVVALAKQKEDQGLEQASSTEDGIAVVEGNVDPLAIVDVPEDMEHDTTTIDMIIEDPVAIVVDIEINDEEIEAVKNLVKEMVASEIDNASSEVEDVKQKAETVDQADIETFKQEAVATEEEEDLEAIDTLEAAPEEVDQSLEDAKILIEDGFLKDAFEKVSEVKEDYQKAGAILEKIEEAIDNNKTIDSGVIDQIDSLNNVVPVEPATEVEASTIVDKPQEVEIKEEVTPEVIE